MPFSFPSSPSIGDKSTQNSREYEWSGYAWEIVATPAALSASVITSGTFDAARLPLATTVAAGAVIVGTGLGVSSGTVSVTYGTSAGTACQGNDSRLSDARTPTSHSHGNITNAGAIGSTANLPIITTTSGVLTTGSFGTSAATFCEGNDSRLSDTRTPTDGSVTTAKLANDAVTYAKIQNVSATDRLLGRSSAGSGDVEEITCTAFGRSLIDDADAAAARTTLSVQPTASPAFTGAATVTNDGNVVPLTVTNTGTANSFVVNDASGDTSPFVIDAAGNVGVGTTAPAAPLDIGSSSGVKVFTYKSGGANAGIGTDLSGAAYECSLFAGGTADTHGRISFGRRRVDTGTYTEFVAINSSGQLLVTAGSGSSGSYKPGIAVSGDDDTGLQQVGGANTISLVTQGSERVRVDASGTVGIASASTAATYAGWLRIGPMASSSLSSNGGLEFVNAASSSGWGWRISNLDAGGGAVPLVFESRSNSTSWAERIRISESGSITAAQVYSDTVGATNRDLFIDNAGKLGYVSSIRASKTNIAAIDDVSWLRDLTPVSFHYRRRNEDGTYSDEADGTLDYGLIAEEVEPVAPEMCFYDVVDGEPQLRGVHYSKLITPMLRYIQQLEARIAALEERLNHA